MKLPKCRTCGHRHPLGAACVGLEAKPREEVLLEPRSTKIFMPAFSSEEDVAAAKKLVAALTPAQKQKAYRERHGDRVREVDRLRKAAKRREAKDGR